MTTTNHIAPLDALAACSRSLRAALMDAANTVTGLRGSREARAWELADQIAAAVDHCERLTTVVTGDVRAEEATQ
jgi:hypothetical protein